MFQRQSCSVLNNRKIRIGFKKILDFFSTIIGKLNNYINIVNFKLNNKALDYCRETIQVLSSILLDIEMKKLHSKYQRRTDLCVIRISTIRRIGQMYQVLHEYITTGHHTELMKAKLYLMTKKNSKIESNLDMCGSP